MSIDIKTPTIIPLMIDTNTDVAIPTDRKLIRFARTTISLSRIAYSTYYSSRLVFCCKLVSGKSYVSVLGNGKVYILRKLVKPININFLTSVSNPSNAFDENQDTTASLYLPPNSFTDIVVIDYGSVRKLFMAIYCYVTFATASFEVYVSNDGVNWRLVTSGLGYFGFIDTFRYVKLSARTREDDSSFVIGEITAFNEYDEVDITVGDGVKVFDILQPMLSIYIKTNDFITLSAFTESTPTSVTEFSAVIFK